MKKLLLATLASLALIAACSGNNARVGIVTPPEKYVSFDPSTADGGLAAPLGFVVLNGAGTQAWEKYGAGNNQWQQTPRYADWFGRYLAFLNRTDSVIDSIPFQDELATKTLASTVGTIVSTGAVNVLTSETGGVLQIKTGATSVAVAILNNSNGNALVANDTTTHWAIVSRVKVATTPDANTFFQLAALTGGTANVGAMIDGVRSTTHILLEAAAGSTTVVDTGVSFDSAYHDVGVYFNGTALQLIYDGALVGPTMTTLTNFNNGPASARMVAEITAGSTNQEIHLDKWAVFTPRAQ